ncbi:hypothetical protein HK405_003567 [Cladochytrium tenue]|nr:hypothetical protein HK405_003567 [Cladochytrium tenue]
MAPTAAVPSSSAAAAGAHYAAVRGSDDDDFAAAAVASPDVPDVLFERTSEDGLLARSLAASARQQQQPQQQSPQPQPRWRPGAGRGPSATTSAAFADEGDVDDDNGAAPVRLFAFGTTASAPASSPYAPLPSSATASSSSSSSSSAARPSAAAAGGVVGTSSDGVFANLTALPDGLAKLAENGQQASEPPSYQDAVRDDAPPYHADPAVVASVAEDGDVLVEGLPVGDFFSFFINLLVSMTFDFIVSAFWIEREIVRRTKVDRQRSTIGGFFLTSMLSLSHASRQGSRAGLGITLIRYGFLVRARAAEAEMDAYRFDPDSFPDEERRAQQSEWVAYLMIVAGFFVLVRANVDFVRVQRVKAVVLATSEHSPA